ncbi:hypothetical protein Bca4012_002825 [Brassica carinata]
MRVRDLINQVSKEWNVGLLEDYVAPADIPLIRSLAINPIHHHDTFCWNYSRNDHITKIQAFVWKVKTPQKLLVVGVAAVIGCYKKSSERSSSQRFKSGKSKE